MRIFISFVLFVFSICFYSCSIKSDGKILSLDAYDSLAVVIDYPLLSSYSKVVPYKSDNGIYAVGYNKHIHSLDFINLIGGENKSIEFGREGADAVLNPVSFGVIDGYIVWKDVSGLALLTMEGKVLNRMFQKEILAPSGKYLEKPKGVTYNNHTCLGIDKNSVLIPLTPQDADTEAYIGKRYDVEKQEVEFLPLKYPNDILENIEAFGGLSFPNIQSYNDEIIYNFPCSSVVYVYNKKSGALECIDMPSLSIENKLNAKEYEKLPPREKFEKESMTSRFDKAYLSCDLGKIYRIHYAKKEKLFDKKRDIFLMVYDRKSKKYKEYLLPSFFSEQYVMIDDVAYFVFDGNNDEIINIAIVDLTAI